jgi:ATP-dependent Clp protease ATP-binding subunit ClpA
MAKMQVDLSRLPPDQQELRGSLMHGYNFTERVRKVLGMAREESARLHHEYVGTEHILLGLIREREGIAATALQNLSVDLDTLHQTVEETVKPGISGKVTGPDLPYTSRAKKVLELAMSEARELNHSYVGTEHLLLGLIREEKGIAAQVLVDSGAALDDTRAEVLRILEEPRPGSQSAHRSGNTLTAQPTARRQNSQPLPRFGERLRIVIADAYRRAAERGVTVVTTADLALALLQNGGGTANTALDRLGLDFEAATLALNDLAPVGTAGVSPETAMSLDRAAVATFHAMESVRQEFGDEVPGTQHLLIALLLASTDVAAVFSSQGISVEFVREAIWQIYG